MPKTAALDAAISSTARRERCGCARMAAASEAHAKSRCIVEVCCRACRCYLHDARAVRRLSLLAGRVISRLNDCVCDAVPLASFFAGGEPASVCVPQALQALAVLGTAASLIGLWVR